MGAVFCGTGDVSVHLMMVSALVWVLPFVAQVTSVAVSALGKT